MAFGQIERLKLADVSWRRTSPISVLIDEYRLYLHPVVLGHGKPFFAGPRPPLRLVTSDRICGDVMRLTYVPA
jgi:hypothetical protein